jgi:excinuclease ABC subunit C
VTKHTALPSPAIVPNVAKTRKTSKLDSLPGIGPARRKALVARFGGLAGVLAATADQLAEVTGISQEMADKIYSALH